MPSFDLEVLPDPAAVAARVGGLILEDRLQSSSADPLPLGLATGRTMEPIYAWLAERTAALASADRRRLRQGWLSFNLDEYVGLPPEDPRSFRAAMAAHLVAPLDLDPAQVCLPDGAGTDPALEADRYAAALQRCGGLGLQLLGLGLNGHVGFNEPPCGATVGCRCVTLDAATRAQNAAAFGGDPTAVPARAITLGLREILAARRLVLVVTGASKASILARLLREPPSPALPASWLQGHAHCRVVADRAAMGEVSA
ncbi:MAG: glucosamine-6-phosphate deaminase [Prochlorococcaceae cyanobacterium]